MKTSTEESIGLAARFPVIDRHIWMHHAAISPWPAKVSAAMADFVADNASRGPLGYGQWLATETRLRERAAQLLGAESADDIALVANTTTGLNRIARGIDWRQGDSVVFPASEFPSNRLPWLALERIGVMPRAVELDSVDPERSLIQAIGPSTRVLSVSSVQYDTGLRLDLERLGSACARHGVMFCIDAIQHLGALPLDVNQVGADFVVAGSHKWMLAPEGVAIFWSHPEARAALEVVDPGWRMFPDPFNFDRPDWQPSASARRFEPGTLNTAAIHGLEAALEVLLEFGDQAMGDALQDRTDQLSESLQAMAGIELISPLERQRRAGIVSFMIDGVHAKTILARLTLNDIHAAVRGPWIRLSPHFYTPQTQIEQTVAAIAAIAR
jgi:cysteine desulfurase / selenocysteine lyase